MFDHSDSHTSGKLKETARGVLQKVIITQHSVVQRYEDMNDSN